MLHHPFSCRNIKIGKISAAVARTGIYQHNVVASDIIAREVVGAYAVSV
jgi:hypothetical protein